MADISRYNVLGIGVAVLTLERARDLIVAARASQPRGYVCCGTAFGLSEAADDPTLRQVFNDAWFTTPDGMPLVWLGPRGVERVYGPDLLLAVCDAGRRVGLKHYFYGGVPGVTEELSTRLRARFPGLEIVGLRTPPFRPLATEEVADLRAEIARVQPDVLWIGLGTPKQERFMAAHARDFATGVMIGVGAAFDFHSGRGRQAPRWIQRSGLEWLFRLCTEPRRLGPRYLKTNPRFALGVLAQKLGLREYPLD